MSQKISEDPDAGILLGTELVPIISEGVNKRTTVTKIIDVVRGGVGATLDTLLEIATELALKATYASPAFTGTPTAPTAAAGTNTTQLATTAHVFAERTNTATLTNKTLTAPTISGILTTAGQVAFPATQNASSNANTLDDYEEGTFNPTIIGTTVAGSHVYTSSLGEYVKIGQWVYVTGYIAMSSKDGAMSGSFVQVSGFPFAGSGANRQGGAVNDWGNLNTAQVFVGLQMQGASAAAYLTGLTAASTLLGIKAPADITNTTVLGFSMCYRAGA